MEKRVLALAWAHDKDFLDSVCSFHPGQGDQEFDLSSWIGVDGSVFGSASLYCDSNEDNLWRLFRKVEPNIILLFHTPEGAQSAEFARQLEKVCAWAGRKRMAIQFIIVRATAADVAHSYNGWFLAPDVYQTKWICSADLDSAQKKERLSLCCDEAKQCIERATSQDRETMVGLGVFLLNRDGHVHLVQRAPGEAAGGKYSTVGGAPHPKKKLEQTLSEMVEDRFYDPVGEFKLGPLLACTNMHHREGDGRHYIDLTFLGTIDKAPEVLTPNRKYRAIEGNQLWFPFSKVRRMSADGMLFRPVENAFQTLHRLLVGHAVGQGRVFPPVSVQPFPQKELKLILEQIDGVTFEEILQGLTASVPGACRLLFEQYQT